MKRFLSLLLAVVLTAAVCISGTVAYLQDDDSDVNVMTLGNVKIEQHEYERAVNADGTYATATVDNQTSYVLQAFTQAKPLYPIVGDPNEPGNSPAYAGWDDTIVRMTQVDSYGSMQVFAGKNAQDKFVTVENTGKSDAYVRTLVAIEIGSTDGSKIMTSARAQTADATGTQPWISNSVGVIEIDGNNYKVVEYVYRGASDVNRHVNGVLPAGDTTYPNLSQVYLKHNATNEDMEAIDGNGNGTLDIFVFSQAVQTEGFADAQTALDTAFGEPTAANVDAWLADAVIPTGVMSSFSDLAALKGKDGNVLVTNDLTADNIIHFGKGTDVELDLNGKTITAGNENQYILGAQEGSKLTLSGNGTVEMGKGFMANKGNAEIVINGGTYNGTVAGTLNKMKHISLAQNNSKIVINGGTFTTDVDNAALFFATSNAVIEVNGGFFENTADKTPDLFSMGTNKGNTNRIIFKGGTFVNWNPLEDRMCYTGEWPENGYDAFSGHWMLVWDGYKVVSETQANGDVWYTVVAE